MNFLKNIIYSLYFFTNLIIWLKVFKIHSNKNNTNLKYVTSKKNLYVLRKLVKEHNPKKIVEFGSGVGFSSEAIIDEMSKDSYFIGLESSEQCINILAEKFKRINKNFEFKKSDIEISKDKITQETLIYKLTKKMNFSDIDLIYIDGPSFFLDDKKNFYSNLIRGDIFYIYDQLKPGCVIIMDGSIITQKNIIRFFKSIKFLGVYKTFVFKITDKDKLFDSTYAKLKKWGYI